MYHPNAEDGTLLLLQLAVWFIIIMMMIYDDALASVCLGAHAAAARKWKTHAGPHLQNEATHLRLVVEITSE